MQFPKQCVILVGGKGSRLGDRVRTTPKPMLPVKEEPFLGILLREIGRHGFRKVLLLAGYQAGVVKEEVAALTQRTPFPIEIEIIEEPELMGTGGALKHATAHLDPQFLLVNGDSLFDFNVLNLTTAPLGGNCLGWIALKRDARPDRFGTVKTDGDLVVAFHEKQEARSTETLINTGVYWLDHAIIDYIDDGKVSLEKEVFPHLADRNLLRARIFDGFFIDIGTPDSYAQAQQLIPAQICRSAVFLDRDGVINKDSGYPHLREHIDWIDGAIDTIKAFNDAGWFVFVVTNQSGVARGYYTENDVKALHEWMSEHMARAAAHVDAFSYCPYHPEGTVAKYARSSRRRKPNPGMILDLCNAWPVRKDKSILIGDKQTDIDAATAAGIRSFMFDGGSLLDYVENISLPDR